MPRAGRMDQLKSEQAAALVADIRQMLDPGSINADMC
jgi:hypothetical protein